MSSPAFDPVTLEGEGVRLEPLEERHRTGLARAIRDGELWTLFVTLVPHPDDLDHFFERAAADHARGDGLTFATVDRASGEVAGSTRFLHSSLENQRTEIGFTFLGRRWQRSATNTEAKLLMLAHAFETLDCNRVEFLTDFLNTRSREAILRLGAREEGVLRAHMVMPDGRIRDSVIFSVTRSDWPGVRQQLEHRLRANQNASAG